MDTEVVDLSAKRHVAKYQMYCMYVLELLVLFLTLGGQKIQSKFTVVLLILIFIKN